jgi:hypothetical protein
MSHPSLMRLTATVQNLVPSRSVAHIGQIFIILLILALRSILHSIKYFNLDSLTVT